MDNEPRSGKGALVRHLRVYLDDNSQPIVDREPPAAFELDTLPLSDGSHRLVVRAIDQNGHEGVEVVPFAVQNGPGISISGLPPNSVQRGILRVTVDAFSAEDPFDPRRAEARSEIPVWVWVLSLFVIAWAVWYAARMWEASPAYSASPTFSQPPRDAATRH